MRGPAGVKCRWRFHVFEEQATRGVSRTGGRTHRTLHRRYFFRYGGSGPALSMIARTAGSTAGASSKLQQATSPSSTA